MIGEFVLSRGAPGDGGRWEPVLSVMRGGVRAVCSTSRWFGPAAWDDDGRELGTEAHARQLIEIIEGVATRPAAGAAWSYSTHVVLSASLLRPDLVGRVFLHELGLFTYLVDPAEIAAREEDARAAFGPIGAAPAERGPEAAVEALFDASGGVGSFAGLSLERRDRYLAGAGVTRLLMGGGRPPANITADDLARIRANVTVGVGERIRPIFAIPSRAVARRVSGARLRVVEGPTICRRRLIRGASPPNSTFGFPREADA